MREFLILMGQLLFITCLQLAMEAFFADRRQSYLYKLTSLACYLGALYLVLDFVYRYLLQSISRMFLRL